MRPSQSTFTLCGARASQRPLALALALGLGVAPLAGLTATIIVKTTADAGGAGTCTVRQAIVSMNTGSVSGSGCTNTGAAFRTNDTINFDTTTFPNGSANTISLADAAASTLTIGDLNLTIDASANGQVTIQRPSGATNDFGIMVDPGPGSLTLNHLTLSNGRVSLPAHSCYKAGTFITRDSGGGICIPYANLTLTNSTLSGNTSADNGGGIYSSNGNITLTNSTLSGNSAGKGGGIYSSNGNITLTNSTLSGNTSGNNGGGIYIPYGRGSITLTNSTLSGNGGGGSGGGISSAGSVTLTNSTLSGNTSGNNGGGIYNPYGRGSITLTNSTLSGNSAYLGGGIYNGIYMGVSVSVQVSNSIVAGNIQSQGGGDIVGSVSASSTNNFVGGSPMLGALANNGGPTQTMLPLAGSPVIDAGNDATCPATDQRGVRRPQGSHCDIGAVELVTDRIFADNFDGTPTP
jgi:predicted outer membrane repeat protein